MNYFTWSADHCKLYIMVYEVFPNSKPSIFQIVLFWGYSGLVILKMYIFNGAYSLFYLMHLKV